jgi:hypothetical protein
VQLRFYSAMAVPVLPYGVEAWTVMSWDQSTLQGAEICFLRGIKESTR